MAGLVFSRTTGDPDDGALRLGTEDAPPRTGLVFRRAADGSAKLQFGWDGDAGGGTAQDADIAIDAGFAADLPGAITLAVAAGMQVDAGFAADMPATVGLLWDNNVSRPTVGQTSSHWQDTAPRHRATRGTWRQAAVLQPLARSHWQDAAPIATSLRVLWRDTLRTQRALRAAFEQARRLPGRPLRGRYQETERLRSDTRAAFEQARRLSVAPLRVRYQETHRDRRARADTRFEQARTLFAAAASSMDNARRLPRPWDTHFQTAWPPRPGMWLRPVPPGGRPPCYDPARAGLLVFANPWTGDGHLLFVCERAGPGPQPEPPPHYVIPLLEVYVSVHTLNAVLLPSLEPVALLGATLESDDGGFGWSLSADGPEHLLDQLAPASGLPARVRITIDGIDWVFAVERVGRTRRFGQHRASIQGRSVTALLGDPYMPQQSWLSSSDYTAQQLVAQALQYTGTTVDWGINDWLVPAGAWSFTGTPLQAALRVAESAGAVLRSHRTNAELIFAPRYPALPWAWAGATPNVQMPAAIITTDSLEPEPRPAYNAVYVSGMAQGVLGHVRRSGTAGDLLAPQVTDALITHEVAARQRGSAVLGAAGHKLTHTMTLPLLTGGSNPGLIQPGYLIEVNDIGHTWRGLVRGIRVTAGLPTVRQTITVEREAVTP